MRAATPIPLAMLTSRSFPSPRALLLLYLPAGGHPHLLHGAVPARQIDSVVEVHRAADVVGDDPQRVSHLQVVLPAHGEHPVLLCEPLEPGLRVPHDVAEPLEA